MNTGKALVLFSMTLLVSCKIENEPAINLSQDKPSIVEINSPQFTAPPAEVTPDNPYSRLASDMISEISMIYNYLSYFKVPSRAKGGSENRIVAANGVTPAVRAFYNYSWSDDQIPFNIGYQISLTSNGTHLFEIFLRKAGFAWKKYIHIEEKLNSSDGYMYLYDAFGSDPTLVLREYAWSRTGHKLIFSLTDYKKALHFHVSRETMTGATNISKYDVEKIQYTITWDDLGNGSWIHYNEDGVIDEEGNWEI